MPQLEALEPRLLLDSVVIGPGEPLGTSYQFTDLGGTTIQVDYTSLVDTSTATLNIGITVPGDPATGTLATGELIDVTVAEADETAQLSVRNVGSAGLEPVGQGAAVYDPGDDAQFGTEDDVVCPDGSGPARLMSVISDGPMSRVFVDGLLWGGAQLDGGVGSFYTGYLDGPVEIHGNVGQFRVGTSTRIGFPTDPPEAGPAITIYGAVASMDVGADLIRTVTIGDEIPYDAFQQVQTFGESEAPGDADGAGAVFGRNDTAATAEEIASISGEATIGGSFSLTQVPDEDPIKDFVDFYSFAAKQGSTIEVTGGAPADPASMRIWVLGRRSNGGYEVLDWDYDESDGTFNYRAQLEYAVEATGQFFVGVTGVLGIPSLDASGALLLDGVPAANATGSYLGRYFFNIQGMSQTGLGALHVGGNLGSTELGAQIYVGAGDVGQVVIDGNDPNAGPTDPTGFLNSEIHVPGGSLTYIQAPTYTGGVVEAGYDLGHVRGDDILDGGFYAGRDLQRVDVSGSVGDAEGAGADFEANRHVGQVMVGGDFFGGEVTANADWIGEPGMINFLDVGGDLSTVTSTVYLSTGPGGDVRFMNVGGEVYYGGLRQPNAIDWQTQGSNLEIVDDNGSVIELGLGGPLYDENDNLLAPGGTGSYLTYPVEGSIGVVTLNLTLAGNATARTTGDAQITTLNYTSRQTNAPLESLHLLNSGAGGKLDVYHFSHTGRADVITNDTGGSVNAAEMEWVREFVWDGPVGYNAWPDGDPAPLPSPVQITTAEIPGGQFSGPLNGILARGNLASLRSDGPITDVICLQDTATTGGYIRELIANADGVDDPDVFEGIDGFVYAHRIEEIDVGEGIAPNNGTIEHAVVSETKIHQVWVDGPETRVRGPIWAANNIDRVDASGGASLEDWIVANGIDQWSVFTQSSWLLSEVSTVQRVMLSGPGTTMDGGSVHAGNVNNVLGELNCGGVHDSVINGWEINRVEVDGPIVDTRIDARNIAKIISTGPNGILDEVDATARYEITEIAAPEIVDSEFSAERYIGTATVTGDVTSTTFEGGGMQRLDVGGTMTGTDDEPTTLEFAGPLDRLTVGGHAEGIVRCTGPNADVGLISAGSMDLEVLVEGFLTSMRTAAGGDMVLDLRVRGDRAGVQQINSGGALTQRAGGELTIEGPAGDISSHGTLLEPGVLLTIDGDAEHVAALSGSGGPAVIAGNVIVNGYLEAVEAHEGIDGLIEASRGIGMINSGGDVSATARIRSGVGLDNLQILGGDLLGTVVVRDGLGTLQVTERLGAGGTLGGTVTSQQGSLGTLGASGAVTATINAHRDVTRVTAGTDLAGVVDALRTVGTVSAGALSGHVHGGRAVNTVNVTGAVSGTIESDDILGTVTAGSLDGATLAAKGDFGTLRVLGDAVDSHALAGYGLGEDGALGGGDDELLGGDFHLLDVTGDWINSVGAAGVGPGADGTFGTLADEVAPGQSAVKQVRVAGEAVDGGLARYGFFADTALPSVTVNGTPLPDGHVGPGGAFQVHTVAGTQVPTDDGIPLTSGVPIVLTDAFDGDQITVSLTGPGQGMLLTDTGGLTANALLAIGLDGTSRASSALVITIEAASGGDGAFSLGSLTGSDDAGLQTLSLDGIALSGGGLAGLGLPLGMWNANEQWLDGDANKDGVVDGLDMTALAANWGPTDGGWAAGDLNNDGVVDGMDLTVVAGAFGNSLAQATGLDLGGAWELVFGGGTGIFLDGNVGTATLPNVAPGAHIDLGGDVDTLQTGVLDGVQVDVAQTLGTFTAPGFPDGTMTVRDLGEATVNGDLGADLTVQSPGSDPRITVVGGTWSGRTEAAGDLDVLRATDGGQFDQLVLVGAGDLNRLEGGDATDSHVAIGGDVNVVDLDVVMVCSFGAGRDFDTFTADEATDTSVMAGYFPGADALVGTDDDVLGTGSIGSVAIAGLWERLNVTAGVGVGEDGQYGTNDDTALEGVSEVDEFSGGAAPVTGATTTIIGSTGVGTVTGNGNPLVSGEFLMIGTRPNLAGPPRVLYAEKVGTTIVIKLSELVLGSTVNDQTFLVEDATEGLLTPVSVTVNMATNTAVYNHGLPFPSGDDIVVTLVGAGAAFVTDLGGRALAGDLLALPLLPGEAGSDYTFQPNA